MELSKSRRVFIKNITALGIVSQMPVWMACDTDKANYPYKVLTQKQQKLVLAVCEILFPESSTISIKKLHTIPHLDFILNDDNYDADEKNYLLEGISKTNSLANTLYDKDFYSLSPEKQLGLIKHLNKTNWGSYWLSKLMTVIFESLLLDPIYNINYDRIGWKWLEHSNGSPPPTLNNKYQKLLKKKDKTTIYTTLPTL